MRMSDGSSDVCSSDLQPHVTITADIEQDIAGAEATRIGYIEAKHALAAVSKRSDQDIPAVRVGGGHREAAIGHHYRTVNVVAMRVVRRTQLFEVGHAHPTRHISEDFLAVRAAERMQHAVVGADIQGVGDRKSTRLNSSH